MLPSAVGSLACIEHITEQCSCSAGEKTLRYRYTLDELPALILQLRDKVQPYESWLSKTLDAFDSGASGRICE